MKVAVITPTVARDYAFELTAMSVAALDTPGLIHVVVTDGCDPVGIEHGIPLPRRAGDAGATPRGVGSVYALGQGADVIAFLDSGNTFEPNHVRIACEAISNGADVVISKRRFIHPDGTPLYVDEHDSDDFNHVDTNCIVLGNDAAKFSTLWNWNAKRSGADRNFWPRLKNAFEGNICRTGLPTVNYTTEWLVHYCYPGAEPPPVAKVPVKDEKGDRSVEFVRPLEQFIRDENGQVMRVVGKAPNYTLEPGTPKIGTEMFDAGGERFPGCIWTLEVVR